MGPKLSVSVRVSAICLFVLLRGALASGNPACPDRFAWARDDRLLLFFARKVHRDDVRAVVLGLLRSRRLGRIVLRFLVLLARGFVGIGVERQCELHGGIVELG